jgi:hypothetical protein
VHRSRIALLLCALALPALTGCGTSSGGSASGGIQGGGNGSGDAAPGEPSGGGGIQSGGGLAGASPGGGSSLGSAPGGGTLSAYDPVGRPLRCMRRQKLRAYRAGVGAIQVAPKATGPRVVFASTTGDAQAAQIHGQAEGAEIIGNALLFVRSASDGVIKIMEKCLDTTPY